VVTVVATMATTLLAKIATGTMQIHIDHIDPRWEEGRDYQLVCGLNTSLNYCERDPDFNVSKNNRFLPWRVSEGEIGSVPVNKGDLCQFLDINSGEWVLEEFLGDWWFAQTHTVCGTYLGGKAITRKQFQEMGRKGSRIQIENKIGIYGWSDEQKRQRNIRANKAQTSEQRRQAAHAQNAQKWQCTVTGYISTAAGLSHYQRHKGINISNRTKV
jgi:hypothetical protein